jgi:serine/threonine-protein kinase
MSPEQAQGRTLDERSDIFSFGAVLDEMLAGAPAFSGDSTADILSAILRDEPRPLKAPALLERIVRRCLAKDAAQRFQSMGDLASALQQAIAKPADLQPSIAVLPFANMSRDPDDEYFSDGLTEEIINLLAHVPGLKVTARTSAFAFRGKEQDITTIADALRVRTILEGSVRRAGTRIRVTAQLINAEDGYHLWSERYDRELTDVFAIQDDIAQAIAGALQVTLTAKPAQTRHTPVLAAYEAVLKGRHQMLKHSPASHARANDCFEQAMDLDPTYAEPHASLGTNYFLSGMSGLRSRGRRCRWFAPRRRRPCASSRPIRVRTFCSRRSRRPTSTTGSRLANTSPSRWRARRYRPRRIGRTPASTFNPWVGSKNRSRTWKERSSAIR